MTCMSLSMILNPSFAMTDSLDFDFAPTVVANGLIRRLTLSLPPRRVNQAPARSG
jgi:hypothetical protein